MAAKQHILVVEDSATQARWLAMLLKQAGYGVRIAENGQEALSALTEWRPELIITDIMMPKMDGFQLCRNIKSDSLLRRIPVILLTALSDPHDVLNALKCGAENFVTKPFDPDLLISRVEDSLRLASLQSNEEDDGTLEKVLFNGEIHEVPARLNRVIPLLLSTYEEAVAKNKELKDSLDTIRALEADYRAILEANADGILVCNREGVVEFANPAAAALLGKSAAELVSQRFAPQLELETTTEQELTTASGETIVVEMSVAATLWERTPALLASLRDVTDKVQMRKQLKTMAYDDELTGLRNRRGFSFMGDKEMKKAARRGDPLVLFFLDLDGLKWINDNLGHQAGDQAIIDMANILSDTFRQTDIIARLGGDEFAVIALDIGVGVQEMLSRRLQRMMDAHNATASRSFTLAASVGSVVFDPSVDETLEELLTRGDAVMYEVKRERKLQRGEAPTGPIPE